MTVLAQIEPQRRSRNERIDDRKKLKLVTSARAVRFGSANVLVHDLSAGGMLVQSDLAFEQGETIEVQLPGTGAHEAQVVWSGGNFFGCVFVHPISAATVSAALLRGMPGSPAEPERKTEPAQPEADFAQKLVALRNEHGWTIEQLANRLGVSRQAVWYWETGQRLPRAGHFKRIADAFSVLERDLLGHDGEAPSHGGTSIVDELRKQIAARLGCDDSKIRILIDL